MQHSLTEFTPVLQPRRLSHVHGHLERHGCEMTTAGLRGVLHISFLMEFREQAFSSHLVHVYSSWIRVWQLMRTGGTRSRTPVSLRSYYAFPCDRRTE
jgi:hypothetical protein